MLYLDDKNVMPLRLYSATGANCCERVQWPMDFKGVQYEVVDIEHASDVSQFNAESPFARVPLLIVDGQPLSESMAIAKFIEELVPWPQMLGTSAFGRARVREVCEAVNSSIHPIQSSSVVRYFHPEWTKEQMRPIRAEWIVRGLTKLEPRLWTSSPYAVGHHLSLADIFVGVMYQKARSLGINEHLLPTFLDHWKYLMKQELVHASCPYGGNR